MRPRVFPAEDVGAAAERLARYDVCFNEAAGIPRGRRVLGRLVVVLAAASMRPRVFPAEDEQEATSELELGRLQ